MGSLRHFYAIIITLISYVCLSFCSSAELLEHVASLPINKVGGMPLEMRHRFAEIGEEKALVLHDTLEAVERLVMQLEIMPWP